MADETTSIIEPGELAAHEPVPQIFKHAFKLWKGRIDRSNRGTIEGLIDLNSAGVKHCNISADILSEAIQAFQADAGLNRKYSSKISEISGKYIIESYSLTSIPGLIVIPSLLPPATQKKMLSRLFHRDLSNSAHQTNLHLHYDVQYPGHHASEYAGGNAGSFFGDSPDHVAFLPKNAQEHKPLTIEAALKKKLRWMTLGGQYDWTTKAYPKEPPPPFPEDIASFIRTIFPTMDPQAAIVNVYSPNDTLSMHRDVSEKVDKGLVSISIGCDAIFIIGLADKDAPPVFEVLRLRSGDAVYMTGQSRLAWHGVPSIIPDTCPNYLEDWPGEGFPEWKGWMKEKRINLNVRQMFHDEVGKEQNRL
ncbi:related to oxidoreductase, 2OG-Fe(II) oxygenase family family [Rhynchosporium secalis]|uniref:mRNA N(6)-methyladenine demethylase n=1 Tax=Rhynchosporium secalis TaxID=38038 RepID=A0A1E1M2E0_RHYSE|nr:related to oxidoreductase, 2OG-Fe(II) oxygenase family family [Rhynchosporium secalis]